MSDPNNLVYREQLDDNVIDMLSEDIGSNYSLRTENQKTIAAALNEIHGKDVIANAVGDPLLSTDTYNEMGRKLRDLTVKLKNKLLSNGITIAEYDKLNSLIEKIEVLGEGVGYGLEIVTGECNDLNGIDAARSWYEFHIDYDFGFTPNRILFYSTSTYFCELDNDSRLTIDSKYCYSEDTCFWFRGRSDGGAQQHYKFYIDNITSTGFSIFIYATSSSTTKLIGNKFDALGDGSSAILDTLKDILVNKGVEVTGNESLAELIVKVGELLTEKEQEENNYKDTLYNLMVNGGYELTGEEDINELLEILSIKGIKSNEIKQIACCNDSSTFILKKDGSLYACGKNTDGQLGLGDIDTRTAFTRVNIDNVKQIACGDTHAFILKNDGIVFACGGNNKGQLGLGISTTSIKVFTQVEIDNVKQIACGKGYSILLKNDGTIWSCGDNANGQLGLSDSTSRTTFTQVEIDNVKQIACGSTHTFILKNDGTVFACGGNSKGQLGLNNTDSRDSFVQVEIDNVKQIACGYYYTFILKNDGTVWSCGDNTSGVLGLGTNTSNFKVFTQVTTNINNDVKEIIGNIGCVMNSSSNNASCTFILKNDGSIWACGWNTPKSRLGGLTTSTAYRTFTQLTTNVNNDVKQLACGENHTIILKNDGTVWGCGTISPLGQPDIDNDSLDEFTRVPNGFGY